MSKKLFAVCDLDASYAERLSQYLEETQSRLFEVRAFSGTQALLDYGADHHITLLLISTQAMTGAVRGLDAERIIILSEGEQVREWEEEKHVYKYQSSESLAAEVMDCYAGVSPAVRQKSEARGLQDGSAAAAFTAAAAAPAGARPEIGALLIGVYSPIGRAGKTSFALTLGELLGRSRRVLYLNLEDSSGFESLLGSGGGQDLSDLIYFARQREGDLGRRLESVVRTAGSLDYIPPAFSPSDLRDVPAAEWLELLGRIAECSDYAVIILDVGSRIDEFPMLLRACRKVYMPVLGDRISAAKVTQFEKNLEALDYGDVLEKIEKLRLPRTQLQGSGERLTANLAAGRLGRFTAELIEKDGEWEAAGDRRKVSGIS